MAVHTMAVGQARGVAYGGWACGQGE